MKRYLLIDGFSVLFRMHCAMPHLSYQGRPTNALKGFWNKLQQWLLPELGKPHFTHVGLFLDRKDERGHYRRHRIDPTYKGNRKNGDPTMHESVHSQVPLAIELCRVLGIQTFVVAGEEADDLLAGAVGAINGDDEMDGEESWKEIVSTDKDLLQLIAEGARILDLRDNLHWTSTAVYNKYKIKPQHMSLYLALVGDDSDGYVGVRGIGPGAAQEIFSVASIRPEDPVGSIYAHRQTYSGRIQKALKDPQALEHAYQLARLYPEAWGYPLSDLQRKPCRSSDLRAFFRSVGFRVDEETIVGLSQAELCR
jgi:5'-3' exonuclease